MPKRISFAMEDEAISPPRSLEEKLDGLGLSAEVDNFKFRDALLDGKLFSPMEEEWDAERKLDPTMYKFDFHQKCGDIQHRITHSKPQGPKQKLKYLFGLTDRGPEKKPEELLVVHHVRSKSQRPTLLIIFG